MSNLINVGRMTSVYGIKGWLKVHSQTEPPENIFSYQPWYLKTRHGVKEVELLEWRPHGGKQAKGKEGSGFVVSIAGIEDRNQAELLAPVDIAVDNTVFADLEEGEYYWHQLEGLRVISEFNNQPFDLGVVTRLMATGANDVLVVQGDSDSLDQKERLIPYVPDQFVKSIAISQGVIHVEWDPEF